MGWVLSKEISREIIRKATASVRHTKHCRVYIWSFRDCTQFQVYYLKILTTKETGTSVSHQKTSVGIINVLLNSSLVICNKVINQYNGCVAHRPYHEWTYHVSTCEIAFIFIFVSPQFFLSFHWSALKNWLVWWICPQLCSGMEDKYLRMLLVLGWWRLVLFEPSVY